MDRAEGHSKLLTLICEVEDYYRSYSSSTSLKQAFQLETEGESSKIVVIPVITIGTNNLEKETATIKVMLEWLIKESVEKEAHIKL